MRRDLIDYDYLHLLSPEELEWLNSFTEEYVNADFNHKSKRVHKKIIKKKHIKYANVDKVKEIDVFKSDSYKRNNDRNSDLYTRMQASGKLTDMGAMPNKKDFSFEDRLIEQLDNRASDVDDTPDDTDTN